MARKLVLFGALFFVALVAGAAFAIWIDYNPAGMSPTFYTEKMQRGRVLRLPTVVVLGVVFTILSAFLARRERREFQLYRGKHLHLSSRLNHGVRQHPNQQSD
jgi:hypothetical protein